MAKRAHAASVRMPKRPQGIRLTSVRAAHLRKAKTVRQTTFRKAKANTRVRGS